MFTFLKFILISCLIFSCSIFYADDCEVTNWIFINSTTRQIRIEVQTFVPFDDFDPTKWVVSTDGTSTVHCCNYKGFSEYLIDMTPYSALSFSWIGFPDIPLQTFDVHTRALPSAHFAIRSALDRYTPKQLHPGANRVAIVRFADTDIPDAIMTEVTVEDHQGASGERIHVMKPITKSATEKKSTPDITETVVKTLKKPASCSHCLKFGLDLLKCARCLTCYYCDRDCQRANWEIHKKYCKKPKKKAKPKAFEEVE
jgi:hypothetical protein